METKSDSLLSKVASFFRDIGSSDEAQDTDKSGNDAAQASLKDRIKLKRHDDAIREREFKQLRKIIKTRRTAQGLTDLDPPRPSVISQNSGFSASNRASTLQKINVAEAQLEQWWGGTSSSPLTILPSPIAEATPSSTEPTAPVALANEEDFDLDFTGMTPLAESGAAALDFTPETPATAAAEQASVIEEHPVSQIEECLRDAAICYSEGDFGKAEDLLLTTLKGQRLNASEIELLTFALFDVYRATGQQSHFEVTAMDYAERVGRSPAEWFSIPEQLAQQPAAKSAAPAPPTPGNAAWKCPSTLNNIALAQLQIEGGDTPTCRIDWSALTNIESTAAPTLEKLLDKWCATPIRLEWTGVNALTYSLGLHTHQASSREDERWWRMHMNVLCLLRRPEDFENLALDYCVAFEVSPPNPTEIQSTLVENVLDAPLDFESFLLENTPAPAPAQSTPSGVSSCALVGDIRGDATDAIEKLRTASENVQLLTVSCALLRRIDFTAANAIFNWTKTREASGAQIHFTQVPRLVLIFLLMLGLEKHATLSVRNL